MANVVDYGVTAEKGDIARDGSTSITEMHTIVVDGDVSLEWILSRLEPKQNREHANHPGYFWDRISPNHVKRFVWECECVATPFQINPIPAADPLARPAVITADGALVSEPTNFDYKGRPITTTAGEFIGGVERDRGQMVYHVSKNVGQDPAWLDSYLGAVNLDAVTLRGRTRAKGTLKLLSPSLSDYTVENRTRFCTLTFDLLFDPLGHAAERWNLGTLQLVRREVNGRQAWVQEPIMNNATPRQLVEAPVPLDMRGRVIDGALNSAGDGRPLDVSKMVKLKFEVQPQLPFNGVLPLK